MNEEEMEEFLRANDFGLVIDATHPYAAVVTASVSAAWRASSLP
jgi:precorrin-6x reductase